MRSIKKRKYSKISEILNSVLEKNNLQYIYTFEEIKNKWKDFDKTIAAHSKPVKFDYHKGLLTLKVENGIWKNEFYNNFETLTVKIKNFFRSVNIKAIEII